MGHKLDLSWDSDSLCDFQTNSIDSNQYNIFTDYMATPVLQRHKLGEVRTVAWKNHHDIILLSKFNTFVVSPGVVISKWNTSACSGPCWKVISQRKDSWKTANVICQPEQDLSQNRNVYFVKQSTLELLLATRV